MDVGTACRVVAAQELVDQRCEGPDDARDMRPTGPEFVTVRDTYASPGELDVMAQVTGFTRSARCAARDRSPFTSVSTKHVAVYTLT